MKVQNKISVDTVDFGRLLVSDTNYSLTKKSGKAVNQLKQKNTYILRMTHPAYHFNIYFDKPVKSAEWNVKCADNMLSENQIGIRSDLNELVLNNGNKINRFEIKFLNKKVKNLKIIDVKYYNSYQFEIPRFGFYNLTKVQQLIVDSLYALDVKGDFLNETVVFYRFAENYQLLRNSRYEISNTFNLNQQYFKPEKSGVYQFFISSPMIKGYWLTEPSFRLCSNKSEQNYAIPGTK